MAGFARKAIKDSFMKLLREQPLSEISVRDIVEDCGVNRNSFYYHFKDIPDLIEEIIMECFNALIEKYPNVTSLKECVDAAVRFIVENRKALLHIYNSVNRDIFERYLMMFCEDWIQSYLRTAFGEVDITEKDEKIIIRLLKCELFGSCIDWMNSGLSEEQAEDMKRVLEICQGLSEEIIQRCKETE